MKGSTTVWWVLLGLGTAVLAFVALFSVRRVKRVYLAVDMPQITHGDWFPKAGELMGELLITDPQFDSVQVKLTPNSAPVRNGLTSPTLNFHNSDVEIREQIAVTYRWT